MAYFYKDKWNVPPCDAKSPFTHIMGETIIRFTLCNREWLNRVGEEIVSRINEDSDEFFEFGYELADQVFQNEPFIELIAICSSVSYIAHIFFIMGKRRFMDKAYFMIAIIFFKSRKRFEAKGGWKDFQKLCLEYVKILIKEGKTQQQNFIEKRLRSSEVPLKSITDIQSSTRKFKYSKILRSKSADSIERVTRSISKSTGAKSKSAEAIPTSTGSIPASTEGSAQKSLRIIPKSTSDSQKLTCTIPVSKYAISTSIAMVPKLSNAVAKPIISKKSDSRPHGHSKTHSGSILVTAHLKNEDLRKCHQKSIERKCRLFESE
ncbi:hypothetical protein HNY73_009918 [Argiope bruennichi]|uniref:Uncharacterized protein n=1 Tax=Argiope bruennichi TaxID=94029 RepID=A0A8T0FAZ0_ARGBR|nr:hypothetical protein HNY73_009918 [Argiope bruennichi]